MFAVLDDILYQVSGRGLDHVRGLEGDTDDDTITSPQPQSVTGDMQRRDADKGETKLPRS